MKANQIKAQNLRAYIRGLKEKNKISDLRYKYLDKKLAKCERKNIDPEKITLWLNLLITILETIIKFFKK